MMFECSRQIGRRLERWAGRILSLQKYGTHYEIRIESRSSITVLFGKTSQGGFACMPDFGAGCHIVSLRDVFWNREKLISVLGKVDGITVAEALFMLHKDIRI
jgi:hypothetical protein